MLNWGIPFYLLGLYGIARFFIRPKDDSKPGTISWSPLDTVSIAIAIYFISQIIGALLAYIYPLTQGWSSERISAWFEQNVYGQFSLMLGVEVLAVVLIGIFLRRRQASFKTIGLKRSSWLRDIAYILMGFGIYFVLYLVVLGIVQMIAPIDVDQRQQLGFGDVYGLQLIPVFISLVILPPVAEELLIRGFLYSGLKKNLPKIWAVLIASALFAVAHLQAGSGEKLLWVAAVDTFVLSLVLIFLREKTGSLHAPIGLHMLKNFIAFLSLFVFHLI